MRLTIAIASALILTTLLAIAPTGSAACTEDRQTYPIIRTTTLETQEQRCSEVKSDSTGYNKWEGTVTNVTLRDHQTGSTIEVRKVGTMQDAAVDGNTYRADWHTYSVEVENDAVGYVDVWLVHHRITWNGACQEYAGGAVSGRIAGVGVHNALTLSPAPQGLPPCAVGFLPAVLP